MLREAHKKSNYFRNCLNIVKVGWKIPCPVQSNKIQLVLKMNLKVCLILKLVQKCCMKRTKTVVDHRVDQDGVDPQIQCNVDMDVEAFYKTSVLR